MTADLGQWIQQSIDRVGISQAELARQLTHRLGRSIDKAAINKIVKNRRNVSAQEWMAIGQITGLEEEFAAFSREHVEFHFNTRHLMKPDASGGPRAVLLKPRRIPMYGHAVAGSDGTEMNDQVVDWTFSPPGLDDVTGIYSSYVNGTTMLPRYRPGETVWMHPNRPPRTGDDVFIQLNQEGTGVKLALVREFVGWEGDALQVIQLNPKESISFARASVFAVHVIVFCSRT